MTPITNEFYRENFTKLADYMEANEAALKFDMARYARSNGSYFETIEPFDPLIHDCGTVCCAAGNGPRAGIPALPMENWIDYINRVFGDDDDGGPDLYTWCFSSAWVAVDNTVSGAAKRIRYALKHGCPSWSQMEPFVHGKDIIGYRKFIG